MAGGKLTGGIITHGGSYMPTWMNNIALLRATTTSAGDTIKITGYDGTALSPSNPGWITLQNATSSRLTTFQITSDVSILLTGAHWGHGTTGDLTGVILRVLAINDNGTLKWGAALLGGRHTLLTTDTNATATNINTPEEVLCTSAIGSSLNTCREIGWFRANFDDTGGAAEDLWAIQTGIGDVITGQTADGIWQPWNPTVSGWAATPTISVPHWTMCGRIVYAHFYVTGTSNSTSASALLPASCGTGTNLFTVAAITNNGTPASDPGHAVVIEETTTVQLFRDLISTNWTNTGTKSFFPLGYITYIVGPAASFID